MTPKTDNLATIICDTREPWPHPWQPFMGEARLVQGTLETGDFALAGALTGAVVERKTVPDFIACLGHERERFYKELARARFCGSFCIVVEGPLAAVFRNSHAIHPSSIIGTVAAWTRRGFPVVFCDNQETAAHFTVRFLNQQLTEARRLLAACSSPVLSNVSAPGGWESSGHRTGAL